MGYFFKLEALRRFRQFEEDRLQKELSEALRSLERAEAELTQMCQRRNRCEEEFRQRPPDGEAADQSGLYRGYLQRLADQIAKQRTQVRSAAEVCDQVREALTAAMKKRKTLDRLKEKGQRAFFTELECSEQKFSNEMAINRYTRKNS